MRILTILLAVVAPSIPALAQVKAVPTFTVTTNDVVQSSIMVYRMGGTNGIYARNRLERLFRDAQTVRHHGFVSDSRLETVGQVYLGVPPEFPFVAF